jgi:hypothetical protein
MAFEVSFQIGLALASLVFVECGRRFIRFHLSPVPLGAKHSYC